MQTKQRNFDWFSLVVGIVFVIAGIAAYMNPDDTLKFISICIGIGALVKGFYELWFRRGSATCLVKAQVGCSLWGSLISF